MTKNLILFFFLALSSISICFGEDRIESGERIKNIRFWIKENTETRTCLDEYFKRRKQLSIKMGLTPVVVPGSVVVGFVGGAYGGVGLFKLSGLPNGNYADLAALAIGAVLGTAGGFGVGLTEEVSAFVQYFNNQNLLRVIYESRNEGGKTLERFFADLKRHYPNSQISKEQLKEDISYFDESGKLCDGSLVSSRRYKRGIKLKQRLATKKEIFRAIRDHREGL
jgi:hypothetical protein